MGKLYKVGTHRSRIGTLLWRRTEGPTEGVKVSISSKSTEQIMPCGRQNKLLFELGPMSISVAIRYGSSDYHPLYYGPDHDITYLLDVIDVRHHR
jgi:hypothetical protein